MDGWRGEKRRGGKGNTKASTKASTKENTKGTLQRALKRTKLTVNTLAVSPDFAIKHPVLVAREHLALPRHLVAPPCYGLDSRGAGRVGG